LEKTTPAKIEEIATTKLLVTSKEELTPLVTLPALQTSKQEVTQEASLPALQTSKEISGVEVTMPALLNSNANIVSTFSNSDMNEHFAGTTNSALSHGKQQQDQGNDDFVDIAQNNWNGFDTSEDFDTSYNAKELESSFQDTDSNDKIWGNGQLDWNEGNMRRAKHQQNSKIHADKLLDNAKAFGHDDSDIPEEYWINNKDLLIDRDNDGKITEGDVIIDKNGQFLVSANHGSEEFQVLEFVDKENGANHKGASKFETGKQHRKSQWEEEEEEEEEAPHKKQRSHAPLLQSEQDDISYV